MAEALVVNEINRISGICVAQLVDGEVKMIYVGSIFE
jgi:hypothetical protein